MHCRASINGQPPISVTVAKLRHADRERKEHTSDRLCVTD